MRYHTTHLQSESTRKRSSMLLLGWAFWLWLLLSIKPASCSSINPHSIDGRHSFSLTTFDTTGNLQQVENAIRASMLGVPVLCCRCGSDEGDEGGDDDIVMVFVTPHAHVMPSPLIRDVGTCRFTPICKGIAIAHSGIGADGRALVYEAQRMAVQHAYTFDEDIPIERLVSEMAVHYQEYTMKAGVRPFGCALLITHYDKVFKLDPAGSVELLDDSNIGYIGKINDPEYVKQQFQMHQYKEGEKISNVSFTERESIDSMIEILKNEAVKDDEKADEKFMSFLVGRIRRNGDLQVEIM